MVTDEQGEETKGLAIESSIPMTSDIGSGAQTPADVRLRAEGASIEAANPLTKVRIATSADGWMSVGPSGLRFRLVGAASRTNDLVDGRAFADNVLTDTDTVVAGDPRGLELSEVLRSPEAPENFVYEFDLPDDAKLVMRADGTAVDVRRGSDVLAIVQAPSAWGADRAPIKTTVSVSGDRLTVHADHRDEEVAYPAVVDPLVGDSFYWHANDERSETGWSACGCAGMSYLGAYQLDFGRGMYIYSNDFRFFANNATGWGRYFAPGNTTITKARYDWMALTSTYGNMCAVLGIGKTEGGWEPGGPWVGCGNIGPYYGNEQCIDGNNPCQNTGGHPYNIAWFETVASGDGNRDFENYMGQAQFTLRDDTPPSFSSDIPTAWTNGSSSAPIHVDATDDGFGLTNASLRREDNASWTGASTATGSCSHGPRCSNALRLTSTLGDLPEGSTNLTARATDAGGLTATRTYAVRLDRSAPTAALSGSFVDSGSTLSNESTYGLDVSGQDPLSGIKTVEVKLDGARLDGGYVERSCSASDGCPQSYSGHFDVDLRGRSYDQHELTVTITDALGQATTERRQFNVADRTRPDLTVTGGLRSWPAQTGRELAAKAVDRGTGVAAIRVFVKPTDRLTPDDSPPAATDRVQQVSCSQNCSSASGFSTTYRLPEDRPTGRYQLVVEAVDVAGNRSEDRWVVQVVQVRSGRRAKLGLEEWFELDDTATGGESSAYVNGETGNLVWHSTPIVNAGRGLSSVVNLTYNSGERGGVLGADLGRLPLVGVNADDDEVLANDVTGLAYREAGVGFSLAISGPTRVNEPLGGVLAARAVEVALALDYVYRPVNPVNGAPCSADEPIGRVLAAGGVCILQLQEVRQPTWNDGDADSSRRKISLTYTQPSGTVSDLIRTLGLPSGTLAGLTFMAGEAPQIASIADASGRRVDLSYVADGPKKGYLREVRENAGATGDTSTGDVERVTRLRYDEPYADGESAPRAGDLQQLTDVVPVVGGVEKPATRFVYEPRRNPDPARPPAPRRVAKVVKRSGAPKLYRYAASEGRPSASTVLERTTGERYLSRETTLDAVGRPVRVVEGAADVASETADPQPVAAQGTTDTRIEWNDTENKLAKLTEAAGTSDERTTTMEYRSGGSGALIKRTVAAKDVSRTTQLDYYGDREAGFVADLRQTALPGGRTWNYDVDERGNTRSTTTPAGVPIETTFGAGGVVTGEQDEMGRWRRYGDFDPTGQPRRVTVEGRADEQPRVWLYRYDERGDVTRVADPRYGGDGSLGEDESYVTSLRYDAFSRLIREKLPRHDGASGFAGDRFAVRTRVFDRDGNATSVTDPRGLTTEVDYDADEQPVAIRRPGTSGTEITRRIFDDAQRLIATAAPKGAGDAGLAGAVRGEQTQACEGSGDQGAHAYLTRLCLDHRGRPIASAEYSTRADDIAQRVTTMRYDARDNVVARSDANQNASRDASGRQQPKRIADAIAALADGSTARWTAEYDLLDRATRETERPSDGPARPRRFDFNEAGDLINVTDEDPDAPDRVTLSAYDAMGRKLSQTDPLGRLTCWKRQADGLVTSLTTPRGTQGAEASCPDAGHSYTANTTRFAYNGFGELLDRSIPFAEGQYGAGRADVRGWHVHYTRDAVGNPTRITDARDHDITNTFYASGELASTSRPSFWEVQWPDDAANPDSGERFDGSDAADSAVATDGPTVTEREGRSTNAERSGETPEKPESLGKTDLGEITPADMPGWLPDAGQTTLSYDPEMRLAAVADVAGAKRRVDYDNAGRVHQKVLPLDGQREIAHDFDYDANGNLTKVTEDFSDVRRETTYAYDGYDRRISETTPGASATGYGDPSVPEVTRFAYDANDNVTERVSPRDTAGTPVRLRFGYDSLDELTSEANPAGETWRYAYNRFGDRTADEAPHAAAANRAHFTTYSTFDNAGQLTAQKRTVNAPGEQDTELTWDFGYDRDGNRDKTVEPGSPAASTTTTVFDGRGLPWKTTVAGGAGDQARSRTTITEFDANGNLRREVNPAGVDGDGNAKSADTGTNDASNLSAASQDSRVRVFNDDDLQVSERMPWRGADKHYVREWERDSQRGWVTGIRMPHEVGANDVTRTTYKRNDAGWITELSDQHVASRSASNGYSPLVTYSYDKQGNQTRAVTRNAANDAGRDMRWEFWPNGLVKRRKAYKTVDNETTVRSYDYLYNVNRSLVRVRDHDYGRPDRTTVFARDLAERETRIDADWTGTGDVLLGYDDGATGWLTERRTDGVFGADGAYGGANVKRTTFVRDSLGREARMTVDPPAGLPTRVTKTSWYGSGKMRERTKPNGTVDRYAWDGIGQLGRHDRIRQGQSTDPEAQSYAYDANGNRTRDERGEHEFNARDQLTRWKRPIDRGRADRRGWTVSYDVDGSGGQRRKTERDDKGAVKFDTENTLDGERLTKSVTTDKTQLADVKTTQTFRYDDAGNVQRIYTQVSSASGLPVTTPEPGKTALSPSECQNADNTTSTTITRYCYDEFNRQVFASGSGITDPARVNYDGLDRRELREQKDIAGIVTDRRDYTYVGTTEQVATETKSKPNYRRQSYDYDSQGDRAGVQIDGVSGQAPRYRPYAKDANGSVVGLEKPDGTISEDDRYFYDPFGDSDRQPKTAKDGNTDPATQLDPVDNPDNPDAGLSEDAKLNPFRFEGFYLDSGVKTYDMHARHYRPDVGRFLSRDSYAAAAGDEALSADPLTQNRYAFAGANPVNNVEFDGHTNEGRDTDSPNPHTRAAGRKNMRQRSRAGRATPPAPYTTRPDYGGRGFTPRGWAPPRVRVAKPAPPKLFGLSGSTLRSAWALPRERNPLAAAIFDVAADTAVDTAKSAAAVAPCGSPLLIASGKCHPSVSDLANVASLGVPESKGVGLFGRLAARSGRGATKEAEGVSWVWKTRPRPGADGGISKVGIERSGDDAISQVHRVTVDGRPVHQHQTHIGKYGGQRQFPDDWVQFPGVGSP